MSGRLLDIGSGFGHVVAWALENGWDAWGVEPDPWGRSRSVAPDRVVATADELTGTFDVVTMWDVLEHVGAPLEFLGNQLHLVRPGGRIVVCSPDFTAMKLRWAFARYRPGRFTSLIRPEEHVTQFTRRGIALALERAGYVNVEFVEPPGAQTGGAIATWLVQRVPALRQGFFAMGYRPT
jgi:SAM-dependent methyltransferase